MSFPLFHAHRVVQHGGFKLELLLQQSLEFPGIFCYDRNNFSANLTFQFLRRAKSHQSSFIEDRKPVAVFSFFENVRSDHNGDAGIGTKLK